MGSFHLYDLPKDRAAIIKRSLVAAGRTQSAVDRGLVTPWSCVVARGRGMVSPTKRSYLGFEHVQKLSLDLISRTEIVERVNMVEERTHLSRDNRG